MKVLQDINRWLADPKRDYHVGLAYFLKYASRSARERFAEYFNEIPAGQKPDQFDSHFTILANQVSFVKARLQANPEAFAAAAADDENTIHTLHVPVRVITLAELPPDQFVKERERLAEIVPLMAKIHAEMAAETADDKRKILADQLVNLDTERRAIWDVIDENLDADGAEVEHEPATDNYSENEVVRGAQMASRVERLKENIKRSEAALGKHREAGKLKLIDSTVKRIEKYTAELAELEAQLSKE